MKLASIHTFASQARLQLMQHTEDQLQLVGITRSHMQLPLAGSNSQCQLFDAGLAQPASISGEQIAQREQLVQHIEQEQSGGRILAEIVDDIIEHAAYTWFNRLLALRYMEVNGYLHNHAGQTHPYRILSSANAERTEPDILQSPLAAGFAYTEEERADLATYQQSGQLDALFRLLFFKQCSELGHTLGFLFSPKQDDYVNLLFDLSYTQQGGVIRELVDSIPEQSFAVKKGGQVEMIGWLYQEYHSDVRERIDKNIGQHKIGKAEISPATQLFTPDWIVKYLVENSLGHLLIECADTLHLSIADMQDKWEHYYSRSVQPQRLQALEDITVFDPCVGSGHMLVYAFDLLMQAYLLAGFREKDAARSILMHNLLGTDIDARACQLAAFSLLMKAREHCADLFMHPPQPRILPFAESNTLERSPAQHWGKEYQAADRERCIKNIQTLCNCFEDGLLYGSLLPLQAHPPIDTKELQAFLHTANDSPTSLYLQRQLLHLLDLYTLLTRSYHVVLTNPPYKGSRDLQPHVRLFLREHYKDGSANLLAAFMIRCLEFTKPGGYSAMITIDTWMFIRRYKQLRERLLTDYTVVSMLHTGAGTFQSINTFNALATAFVLQNAPPTDQPATYIRLLDYTHPEEKQQHLHHQDCAYTAQQSDFKQIPGWPLVYWASDAALANFATCKQMRSFARPRQGLATGKNKRFVRYWHEVDFSNIGFGAQNAEQAQQTGKQWFPFNKGGRFRKWYGMNEEVVFWEDDGYAIKNFTDSSGKLRSGVANRDWYFKPGITWSLFGFENFAVRYKDAGFLFDVSGSSMFPKEKDTLYILAFLASKVAFFYLSILAPTVNFQVGNIGDLPFTVDKTIQPEIAQLAKQCVALSRTDWDLRERSWDFKRHVLLQQGTGSIEQAAIQAQDSMRQAYEQLRSHEERINRLFIITYGLQEELDPEVIDRDLALLRLDDAELMQSFVSYAVGCMFGRYSLDKDGLVCAGADFYAADYNRHSPVASNILLIPERDMGQEDIVSHFVSFVRAAFGEDMLEENLAYIAQCLHTGTGSSRERIRQYFYTAFYAQHVKHYQRMPIYWQLNSGRNGGLRALVYMHRYTEDTLGRLRLDYLHPLQSRYHHQLRVQQETIKHGATAADRAAARQQCEQLQRKLEECSTYDAKLAHLAPLRKKIDLNARIVDNYEHIQTDSTGKKHSILSPLR